MLSDEKGNSGGVFVYVTEICSDFFSRITSCQIQDPLWVNYDIDGCQVRLDQPLLFDVKTLSHIHWHWKRNAAMNYLHSIMAGYFNIVDDGDSVKKSDSYFMDMKFLLNDLQ